MKEQFLDLGASNSPHPRATHAVDKMSKPAVFKETFKSKYLIHGITKAEFENKLKQMDYKFNFNYNTQKLPWPNNSFKMVYSNGSLGNFGKVAAFREAYRVLKHGGKLIFTFSKYEEKYYEMIKMLKNIGFIKMHNTQGETQIYKKRKIIAGTMVAYKPIV